MSGPLDGTRWFFNADITIGRDEEAARACIAFDRYLSRSHAKIAARGERVHLQDLTSRNGTTIAGRVVSEEDIELGQRFTCGRTQMCVLRAEDVDTDPLDTQTATARSFETVTSSEEMRLRRPASGQIAFVPTMGALHDGHLSLIKHAQQDGDAVVVSIFVNPLQFAAGEDFDRYPRDPERDVAMLDDAGVQILFAPTLGTFYGGEFSTFVDVGDLGNVFEGAVRPQHFRGVATVVTKLLNIVGPSKLYLGQKDAQQAAVVRRLIADLELPVELVVVPTDREPDGLARSSRNVYLDAAARKRAPILYRALTASAQAYRSGAPREEALQQGLDVIAEPDASIGDLGESLDYFEIVDEHSFLQMQDGQARERAVLIGALRLGGVRLIDNVRIAAA